jgi:hypothetical protein
MNIRKRRGPRTEPRGTPDIIGFHEEVTPFKITLYFLFERYSDRRDSKID